MEYYKGHPSQYWGHISYSQHNEDFTFLHIFNTLKVEKPTYLDVGAHHPFDISNTALLYIQGARGVNVEANPNLIEMLRKHRPEDINLNVGISVLPGKLPFYMYDSTSGRNTFSKKEYTEFLKENPVFKISEIKEIETVTLTSILKEHFAHKPLHLLSIDTEGLDTEIILSIDFATWRPTVICTELWPKDSKLIIEYLKKFGYSVLIRMGANLIFMENETIEVMRK